METHWTHPRFQDEEYIRRKLEAMDEYLRACEFMGVAPLSCTVSLLARKIREYRKEHKFYDVV